MEFRNIHGSIGAAILIQIPHHVLNERIDSRRERGLGIQRNPKAVGRRLRLRGGWAGERERDYNQSAKECQGAQKSKAILHVSSNPRHNSSSFDALYANCPGELSVSEIVGPYWGTGMITDPGESHAAGPQSLFVGNGMFRFPVLHVDLDIEFELANVSQPSQFLGKGDWFGKWEIQRDSFLTKFRIRSSVSAFVVKSLA